MGSSEVLQRPPVTSWPRMNVMRLLLPEDYCLLRNPSIVFCSLVVIVISEWKGEDCRKAGACLWKSQYKEVEKQMRVLRLICGVVLEESLNSERGERVRVYVVGGGSGGEGEADIPGKARLGRSVVTAQARLRLDS
ncbi:Protein of unknown function [Gryllus bimaculatus]|nr:Protein of unknown function [Gryllus bimaculatus]